MASSQKYTSVKYAIITDDGLFVKFYESGKVGLYGDLTCGTLFAFKEDAVAKIREANRQIPYFIFSLVELETVSSIKSIVIPCYQPEKQKELDLTERVVRLELEVQELIHRLNHPSEE